MGGGELEAMLLLVLEDIYECEGPPEVLLRGLQFDWCHAGARLVCSVFPVDA